MVSGVGVCSGGAAGGAACSLCENVVGEVGLVLVEVGVVVVGLLL